jgi:hypothetical protein
MIRGTAAPKTEKPPNFRRLRRSVIISGAMEVSSGWMKSYLSWSNPW